LIFLQALMLLLAIRLLWLAANSMLERAALRISPVFPVIAVALVWGYATTVLQQAAILLGIATAMLGFARLRTGTRTWPWLLAGAGLVLGLVSAPVLLGLLAAIGVIVLVSLRDDLGRRSVVGFLVVLGVGTAVLAPWYAFKLSQDMSISDSTGARNFWEASNYQGFGLADRIAAVPSTLLALSSGGIEFQQGLILAPGYENREFGLPQFSPAESCGRRQPYQGLPGFSRAVEQALQDCVATQPVTMVSAADRILSELLALVALAGLAGFVLVLAWVPRTKLDWTGRAILALPWISLGPYAWATGAISRYGLAAFCLDVVLIGAAAQLAAMKWRAGSG